MTKYVYSDAIVVEIYKSGETDIPIPPNTVIKIVHLNHTGAYQDKIFVAGSLQTQEEDKDLLEFIEKSLAQFKIDSAITDERLIAFTRWYGSDNKTLGKHKYKEIERAFCATDCRDLEIKEYKIMYGYLMECGYCGYEIEINSLLAPYMINIGNNSYKINDVRRLEDKNLSKFVLDRMQDFWEIKRNQSNNFELWYNINYNDVRESDYDGLKKAFIAGF